VGRLGLQLFPGWGDSTIAGPDAPQMSAALGSPRFIYSYRYSDIFNI